MEAELFVMNKKGDVLGECRFENFRDCVVKMYLPDGEEIEFVPLMKRTDFMEPFTPLSAITEEQEECGGDEEDELSGLHIHKKSKRCFPCALCNYESMRPEETVFHKLIGHKHSVTGDLLLDSMIDYIREHDDYDDGCQSEHMIEYLVRAGYHAKAVTACFGYLLSIGFVKLADPNPTTVMDVGWKLNYSWTFDWIEDGNEIFPPYFNESDTSDEQD